MRKTHIVPPQKKQVGGGEGRGGPVTLGPSLKSTLEVQIFDKDNSDVRKDKAFKFRIYSSLTISYSCCSCYLSNITFVNKTMFLCFFYVFRWFKPSFHIIASVTTVATVASKII